MFFPLLLLFREITILHCSNDDDVGGSMTKLSNGDRGSNFIYILLYIYICLLCVCLCANVMLCMSFPNLQQFPLHQRKKNDKKKLSKKDDQWGEQEKKIGFFFFIHDQIELKDFSSREYFGCICCWVTFFIFCIGVFSRIIFKFCSLHSYFVWLKIKGWR